MEKLGNTWYFHMDYDMRLLFNYLWWSIGFNDNGKANFVKQKLFVYSVLKYIFNIFVVDLAGASEMFRRNNLNWLSSLSYTRLTLVP